MLRASVLALPIQAGLGVLQGDMLGASSTWKGK